MILLYILAGVASVIILALSIWLVTLRRVVPTNEVHIVQSASNTVSYGKDQASGNTYYAWPSWIPRLGVSTITLPVSVFPLRLSEYEAYDSGRLPFVLDLAAFFRIENSNMAAQRVSNFAELNGQLTSIVQGAARTILASKTIEEIMAGRSEFGDAFTKEVNEQLKAWGVTTVKNIELMDIRDAKGSRVIQNIMEKKKSEIERESRIVVAENNRAAENAEIDARREVEINQQLAAQQVGIRKAEQEREVGLARERMQQTIKEQEKVTAEKQAEVLRVEEVARADIDRAVEVVRAEAEKQKTVLIAEGKLESERREAEALRVRGEATAQSEKLLQLAPVEAQIVLAKEIGENQGYQQYLVTLRQVEAHQAIGVAQAKSLEQADVKVIANAGDVQQGMTGISDLFSARGGTAIAAAIEGLAQSATGKALLDKISK